MPSLEELKKRFDTVNQLDSVVRTMKAMAAASIRQFEEAAEAMSVYSRTVELGLRALARSEALWKSGDRPADPGKKLLIVLGSDYGMVGRFNDLVVEKAIQAAQENGAADSWSWWAVGRLGADRLRLAGIEPETSFSSAGSTAAITESVQDILFALEDWRGRQGVGWNRVRVRLVHNRRRGGSAYQPVEKTLLPLDRAWLSELAAQGWDSPSLPLHTLSTAEVLSSLMGEFIFVALYRAMAESLAGENAGRLAAMQSTEKNIEEQLEQLQKTYQRVRQASITSELMDIVSGFEAQRRG